MKKKLLFVIESLNLGGAEKSLTTLLNLLDYDKYDVDLQLFANGGPFQDLLPKQVNLLHNLDYFSYCKIPYKNIVKKLNNIKYLQSQIRYSLDIRKENYNNIQKPILLWEDTKNCFDVMEKDYDIAIAYAQGLPTFYVADKVKAKKKLAWVNVTYMPEGKWFEYIDKYYGEYDYVNCVSESVLNQFENIFTNHSNKTIMIKDILDYNFNYKMADMTECREMIETIGSYKLLTVGRLVHQKGYDLALEACKILKDRNLAFKWYVIGEGNKREELEQKIKEYSLENHFILLGSKNNPYPYFKNCDIYVQTSRFEGFGITIAEARMFNKPVVTTEFDAVYSQMIQDTNGLVVKMIPEAIAEGIEKMIYNHEYRNKIVKYLETEKKGNTEEIKKFYKVVE